MKQGGRLVGRSPRAKADVAQLAERVLGKDEVTSSILVIGSIRSRACIEARLTLTPALRDIRAQRPNGKTSRAERESRR
jgi:hypothetical protein